MIPAFDLDQQDQQAILAFTGDWTIAASPPPFTAVAALLERFKAEQDAAAQATANSKQSVSLRVDIDRLDHWDALFVSRLYQCALWCSNNSIELRTETLPGNMRQLLRLATAVAPVSAAPAKDTPWYQAFNLLPASRELLRTLTEQMHFIGELCFSLGRLVKGNANVQFRDFFYFIERTGPNALGIVGLISVLVGMILAYLGAVQLALFGAEVYVANLVTIGTLREMGALMMAILMAGRTGAAYAAQLGSMQVNEEVDAITTLGIKPMDFLVLPRLIALLITMPLLCIYADVLSIGGGVLVALGMDVTMTQFITQAREAADITTVLIGLGKSLVFAVVIAIAGCKAGMECGRSSTAVGEATTTAVVNAIVWLVITDAIINISLSNFGI